LGRLFLDKSLFTFLAFSRLATLIPLDPLERTQKLSIA
jgi:hypothetical protein